MKLPEDFFHWQVIFSVRPPQQTVTMFVGKLVRSVVKTEKIGSAIARSLLAVAFIATLASASASAAAQPREQQFNIPKQAVDQALDALATQANVFLLFPYDQVLAVDANPVKGKYSIQQALDILLKNTGLSGDLTQGGVITISPNDLNQNGKGKRMNINKRKNLLATFIAVFAAGATTQGAVAQDGEAATAQSGIDEIVVTATRRATSLQDTAISIAAIGGEEISRRNLSEMKDYLRAIPGINLFDGGVGRNAVVVRGLAMDPRFEANTGSPTTGVYFGEVPLAGLAAQNGSADLKMIDLERVEVLRGPQGTLFGSSSLAGAVRNIPNAPNTEELEGNIKTGYSNTAEFGGSNTKVEGVINIPLIDDILAIRAVAYRHDTSGYIKNIAGTQLATNGSATPFYNAADAVATYGGAELYRDEDDVGNATHTGGRIAVLWKPTDKLDVTLQYVTQDVEQEGIPYVQLNTGGYTQVVQQIGNNVAALSGKELGLKDDISIINLVAEYDLGWATLLSSSAWMEEDGERNADFSWALGGSPIVQPLESSSDIFTQELRLVSSLDGPFQYIAGVYYEDVEYFESTPFYATGDLALSLIVNPVDSTNPLIFDQVVNRPLEQLAFFGEVSYDISDQLTFTGGLRRFDYERSQHVVSSGAFGNSDDSSIFDEAGTSFKANLSYAPNEDTLVYAQWAEGFRLGNAVIPPPATLCDVNNDGILDGTNTPIKDSFDSDSTESIELGVKLALLDNRLQINAAVYRIDWQNIPLSVAAGQLPSQPAQTCFSAVTANAGDARSQGFEIETTYQMTENLQLSLGGAYTNAELTGIASGVSFSTGDRLPSFPDYNLNLGLQYEFELGRNPSYLQADFAYVSEYFSTPGAERDSGPGLAPAAGDYGVLNMSAGIGLDQFNIELFAHNLTNEDALTLVGRFAAQGEAWRLRPRTIGLTVGYKF